MLDTCYLPMYLKYKKFSEGVLSEGGKPLSIALQRGENAVKVFKTNVFAADNRREENLWMVERIIKFMLWSYGGYRFTLMGDRWIFENLKSMYSPEGARSFDYHFMTKVYRTPLTFVFAENEKVFPAEQECAVRRSSPKGGRRIGFDAGGSDRKVTACIDGKAVFEDETVWNPKLHADPAYHEAGICDSIDKALAALGGKADSIGVSTAGIVIDDEVRVASLFRLVPEELYAERIIPIYKNLAKKYQCPVKVANDGDVAALAGAFQTGEGRLLGTAMGTSLAGGFIDKNMGIPGYLNELAFVPVDANPDAAADEWSADKGVGSVYHSQDGVVRLAQEAGIALKDYATPAEKLKKVQSLANEGDKKALEIFDRMGDYYGYSLLWFAFFYDMKNVVFLGRVASGKGGERILERAKEILAAEKSDINIILPDEMSRRLGQSYTAAGL